MVLLILGVYLVVQFWVGFDKMTPNPLTQVILSFVGVCDVVVIAWFLGRRGRSSISGGVVSPETQEDWDTANPLGRLMRLYLTETFLVDRELRLPFLVVNTHPCPKTIRIADGAVEFFSRKEDGGATRLLSVALSVPTVSVPGKSIGFSLPKWDDIQLTHQDRDQILAAKKDGSLELLVSANCAVVNSKGAESVKRFGFRPFLIIEHRRICKDCFEDAIGNGTNGNAYCINHLPKHTKPKEVVVT